VKNVTVVDSVFNGERGLHIKSCPGRGGLIQDVVFRNVRIGSAGGISISTTYDGQVDGGPLPLVANVLFENISGNGGCSFDCQHALGSICFNTSLVDVHLRDCSPLPPTPAPAYICNSHHSCDAVLPNTPASFSTRNECQAQCHTASSHHGIAAHDGLAKGGA
jgi:hypothetical protein